MDSFPLPAPYSPLQPLRHSDRAAVWMAKRGEDRVVVRWEAEVAGPEVLAELEVLAHVEHPNVAGLVDFGEAPCGGWYLARPWIDGADLLSWADGKSPEEIGKLVLRLCPALHALHSRGFVHGDLKPENVIVDAAGEPHLCDFGLAHRRGAAEERVAGTAFAIAPETLLAEPRTERVDLFALGILLLRLIRPFDVGAREFYAEFPRRSLLEAIGVRPEELPDWSRSLIVSLVHRDPYRRPSSAAAVARTLAARLGSPTSASEGQLSLRWAPLFGRGGWVEGWHALADEAHEAGRSCWIRVPLGESAANLAEALRVRASLRSVASRVMSTPAVLEVPNTTAALDRWAAGVVASPSPWVWVVATQDAWSEKAVTHLLRRRRLLAEAGQHAPMVVIVSNDPVPSHHVDVLATEVPRVGADEVARFLSAEVEGLDEQRREALSQQLADAALGSATRAQELLEAAIRSDWFVRGEEGVRLRPGELPLLRTTFDVDALGSAARTLLGALAVCGGRGTFDEVRAVSELDGSAFSDALSAAQAAGLIAAESGHRLVLRTQPPALLEPGEWRSLHRRRARLVEASGAGADMMRAHEWAATPTAEASARLTSMVGELCDEGRAERGLALLDRIEGFATDLDVDPRDVALDLQLERARCWSQLGSLEHAEACLAASEPSDSTSKGRAAIVRARIAALRHETDDALAQLEEAHGLDAALGGEVLAGRVQHLYAQGRDADVVELVEGLDQVAGVTDRRRAFVEGVGAMSALRLGRADEARATTTRLIRGAVDDADPRREAALRINLATIERRTGSRSVAMRALEAALDQSEAAGDLAGVALASATLGGVLREEGRLHEAEPHLVTALELRERLGDTKGVVLVRGLVGLLAFERGHARAAVEELVRALDSLAAGERLRSGPLLEALCAELRMRLGHAPASPDADLGAVSDPRALVSWARTHWIGGQKDQAAALLERARGLAESLGQRPLLDGVDDLMRLLSGASVDEDGWRGGDAHVLEILAHPASETPIDRLADLAAEMERVGRDDRAARLFFALAARTDDARERDEARRQGERLLSSCARGASAEEADRLRSYLLGIPDPWPDDLREPRREEARGIPNSKMLTLLEINRQLVNEEDLPSLLRTIVEQAIGLCEAERGFLVLEEGGTLRFDTALESQRGIAAPELEVSTSIVREALDGMTSLRVSNAVDDPSYGRLASVATLDLRSVLCVPFSLADDLRGALYLDNRVRTGAFDEEDEQVVRLLADQAALAIVQMRRTDELRRLYSQLQKKVVHQARDLSQAQRELRATRRRGASRTLVGDSDSMHRVRALVEKVASADLPILVLGASGTGKDVVARSLHEQSARREGPFVSENCAAIPESLFEAELFGYRRGAFTGAEEDRVGLLERADGGTFFLDEVAELPLAMQAKLLRVLETKRVRAVGANEEKPVDVRLVAATNRDLEEEVESGRFRADLYYRLEGVRIDLPSLDDRSADIPELIDHFLEREGEQAGKKRVMTRRVIQALCRRAWPGNVRELASEVARLCLISEGIIDDPSLVRTPASTSTIKVDADLTLAEVERHAILSAIDRCGGDKTAAAAKLGISRAKIFQKVRQWRAEGSETASST